MILNIKVKYLNYFSLKFKGLLNYKNSKRNSGEALKIIKYKVLYLSSSIMSKSLFVKSMAKTLTKKNIIHFRFFPIKFISDLVQTTKNKIKKHF